MSFGRLCEVDDHAFSRSNIRKDGEKLKIIVIETIDCGLVPKGQELG
jgi:hypothetical protein